MEFDARQIMEVIPHRYPFLLIDKIVEFEEGKRAVGIKNVTMNEPFFQGHFPGRPIMPGVLIAEALAQTGAFVILQKPEFKGKIAVFTGINNFKFKRFGLSCQQNAPFLDIWQIMSASRGTRLGTQLCKNCRKNGLFSLERLHLRGRHGMITRGISVKFLTHQCH